MEPLLSFVLIREKVTLFYVKKLEPKIITTDILDFSFFELDRMTFLRTLLKDSVRQY